MLVSIDLFELCCLKRNSPKPWDELRFRGMGQNLWLVVTIGVIAIVIGCRFGSGEHTGWV